MNNQETKQCKSCGKELDKSAKICPSCGKDQRNFLLKHKIITGILALIVVCIIGGASGGGNDTDTDKTTDTAKTTTSTKKQNDDLELVGDVVESTDSIGITYFKGIIKNNTDRDYSYAQITFKLFDKDGNQIGTALDNINSLEAGGTWKFKAMGDNTEGDIDSYKLDEITGY